MLLTPWFGFVHIPKTGGSFVKQVLHAQLGDHVAALGRVPHEPLESLPDRSLAVLAYVRNPWDWYVSWYHYLTQHSPQSRTGSPLFASAFGDGAHDFATTVRLACVGPIRHHDPRLVPMMDELAIDFYTARILTLIGGELDSDRLTLGRYEQLAADFESFVARTETPSQAELVAALRDGPRVRASEHAPYREYYDDDLRDLVADRARLLVARFGYSF